MKKILLILMFLVYSCFLLFAFDRHDSVMSSGHRRSFKLHVPPAYSAASPTPLLIALHGGGGSGRGMEKLTGFNALADAENFIVVYPDAYERLWNDGRTKLQERAQRLSVDDVGFISAMLEKIRGAYNIDTSMIYAAGISNGGFMCQRLACELSGTFASVATVAATMPQNLITACAPEDKVSVLIINGTDDPLVPYKGGTVKVGNKTRGDIASTAESVKKWVKLNRLDYIGSQTIVKTMKVVVDTYGKKSAASPAVRLYTIEGGGHAWPGGAQYMPKRIIGKVCQDFSATKMIWEFFKAHPKIKEAGINEH